MPPEPWVVRNPSVERPFAGAQIPMATKSAQEQAGKGYPRTARSKAFIISATGLWWFTAGQASPDEAVRRGLERRRTYDRRRLCRRRALDDTGPDPDPEVKVVDLVNEALFGVLAGPA